MESERNADLKNKELENQSTGSQMGHRIDLNSGSSN